MDPARLPSLRHLAVLAAVVRAGGVHAAARSLRLSPSTVSTQLAALGRELGVPLVRRRGRTIEPTEAGRAVADAADEALAAAARVVAAVEEAGPGVLPVGVAEDVPQEVAQRILAPALSVPRPHALRMVIDRPERLFADLASGGLAAVLADRAPPPDLDPQARVHRLGATPVGFMALPALAARLRPGFPASLAGAPLVLPSPGDGLRRRLDQWFEEQGVAPRIAVETDDPALARRFAEAGAGVLAGPHEDHAGVLRSVGLAGGIEARWWLITRGRSRDPMLAAVLAALRRA